MLRIKCSAGRQFLCSEIANFLNPQNVSGNDSSTMILRHFYILTFISFTSTVFAQDKTVSFDKIVNAFKNSYNDPFSGRKNDSVNISSLYRTDHFNVSISEDPIALDTNHLVIKNPYYTDDFDDYDDNYINYPVSYSVIYDKKLISLFRTGKFVCHKLDNMERDFDFEKKLNSKKFKYHWIINDKLAAVVGGVIYVWNDKWTILKTKFPFEKQPKLFEDSEFIVFGDCHGEWGGTIYFFDKVTGEIYFTESTCANSVFKKHNNYLVVAQLGHLTGSTEIKSIDNPRKLTKAKKSQIGKTKDGGALGYADKSEAYKKLLDFYGIQIFSTFNYQDRQLFIVRLNEMTFLTEIKGTEIQIVNPLFDKAFYTHQPVTTEYGNYTLVNLDFYGIARDKEVSVIIVGQNRLIKVDWNETVE
jgi:hypothetical protein